jgi:putative ATP-dependent endonuclease of the OLD family
MFVARLKIEGFRGIRSGEVPLQPFTALIGPNNCGKTTIAECLALAFGRDRLIRSLTEHDFFASNPGPADRIRIIATLTGFEPNEPDNHMDWFRWGRGTVKWLDAETGEIRPTRDKPDDKLACQIAFAARFDRESLETFTLRYFYDADVDPFAEDAALTPVPPELIRKVGFFLVPASRTWDRTISFGSELFRRVVSYVGGQPAVAVLAERDRLRAPATPLESDPNLSELVASINADIKALLGQATELKLRLTSTDSEGVLEAVVPHFGVAQDLPLPSRRHGSGLVSLQTLILLLRFGHMRVTRGEGFMMVIEEPELHVPPPLQRKLLRMMQAMATQTIVTTHSPTVAAIPEPQQVLALANDRGALSATRLSEKPLSVDLANPIRGLLLSDRDQTVLALMHSSVLVPEGKTDANWLRLALKVLELNPKGIDEAALAFAHEIGIVPTKDARAKEVFEYLQRVASKVFCLFDGDPAGDAYTAACCRLARPPRSIVRWPAGWAIENLVGWIVAADPTILATPDLVGAGIPQTVNELVTSLAGPLKTDEIAHGLIADAMVVKDACRKRIACVLRLLADVAADRPIVAGAAASQMHANGRTTVWTFNDAFPGI